MLGAWGWAGIKFGNAADCAGSMFADIGAPWSFPGGAFVAKLMTDVSSRGWGSTEILPPKLKK